MSDASIPCPIYRGATTWPRAEALVAPSLRWTYEALDRGVTGTVQKLRAAGVGRGDRVGLWLPNSPEYVVLLWALGRLGATACVLSTRLPDAALPALLQQARCRLLIAREPPAGAGLPVARPAALVAGAARSQKAHLALGAEATVVFTSGSTGAPKAALHTWGNHYFSAAGSAENIALGPGDRWLLNLPLYHVGGLAILVRCALAGATAVLPDSEHTLSAALAQRRVTHVSLVATQLYRLLQEETAPPAHLRAVLLGGSAIAASLTDAAHAAGWPIHTSYGLTEMASQVTTTARGASAEALRSAGRVLPHRELRLGAEGEILVRGATLFAGYLRNDGLDPARDDEGWFHTRDLGRLDAQARLHVTGRLDLQFISGGENIQPEVVEQALTSLREVSAAVVVPIPDDEFGARPVAFVEARSHPLDLGALAEKLAPLLPRFMIPVAFYDWPGAGDGLKVDRAQFRTLAMRLRKTK